MPQVVQAKCPGCQRGLRIPANWLGQTLRCKHGGTAVQAKGRAPVAKAVAPPPSLPVETKPNFADESQPGTPVPRTPIIAPAPAEPAAAVAEEPELFFPVDGNVPIVRVSARYRRSRAGGWIALAGVVLSLGVIAGAAHFF